MNLEIRKNYQKILAEIPAGISLTAVSKTYPAEGILEVYGEGQRVFGENKVQELAEKAKILPTDIRWHLIGHLQSNKVKLAVKFADLIESADSEKIVSEINRQAGLQNKKIKILLQVKIADEEAKTGFTLIEAGKIFDQYLHGEFPNIEIIGLMGIATFTEDEEKIRREFLSLKNLFEELSLKKPLNTLSMGMSHDFHLAAECGSTAVRIGSAIFGDRTAR